MARKLFFSLLWLYSVAFAASISQAAPLPKGTKLTINPGSVVSNQCVSGSCFSVFTSPEIWSPLTPGTDGGLIIGKSQRSGGQELVLGVITTPGELTSAYTLFGYTGTFATATLVDAGGKVVLGDPALNFFNDQSCLGAGCIGKTELGTLNVAHFGTAVAVGSSMPCIEPECTPDMKAGIDVTSWTVNPDKTYTLDYSWVVQGITGCIFPFCRGVNTKLHLEGRIISCPVVGYAWVSPTERSILVFGSNLFGATSVKLDGANVLFQRLGNDILWVIPLNAVTWPWKPGTLEVINANAGCSGNYPNSCTP